MCELREGQNNQESSSELRDDCLTHNKILAYLINDSGSLPCLGYCPSIEQSLLMCELREGQNNQESSSELRDDCLTHNKILAYLINDSGSLPCLGYCPSIEQSLLMCELREGQNNQESSSELRDDCLTHNKILAYLIDLLIRKRNKLLSSIKIFRGSRSFHSSRPTHLTIND
ncbi:hypothetical protein PGTUg99_036865 [Puccinia graminis f. sp. tritici]|nr:hypothetical protein PGTUg99_036865 [Puccinia graminis f. sp. tritici]